MKSLEVFYVEDYSPPEEEEEGPGEVLSLSEVFGVLRLKVIFRARYG